MFLHKLLDVRLDDWEIMNPNKTPFVSMKIFQYVETIMKREYHDEKLKQLRNVKSKGKVAHAWRGTNSIKTDITYEEITTQYDSSLAQKYSGVRKDRKKIHESTIRVSNRFEVIEMEDEFNNDVEFEVQTFNYPPDSSVDVLKIKQTPIIDHDLIVNMPSSAHLFNYKNQECVIPNSILNEICEFPRFNVEYIDPLVRYSMISDVNENLSKINSELKSELIKQSILIDGLMKEVERLNTRIKVKEESERVNVSSENVEEYKQEDDAMYEVYDDDDNSDGCDEYYDD